ncbi:MULTISPECIES: hypothetical protein [Flavobacteriaceae]|uniref:hypothetical protein n=1 Tax=Flavobacteriaceae TaxID=49546 RepID=UPI0014930F24|nr:MULTISPECIES: hypothetical protein [Allomuricauda]MDC6365364.1 hypothetical protein [Muricauda sp. AC10]
MKIKRLIFLSFFIGLPFISLKSQEITMFAGFWDYQYYQDDKRITKKNLVSLLEKDEIAYSHWKKSKTFSALSYVSFGAEIGFFVWQLDNHSKNKSTTGPFIGVMSSFASFLTFALLSSSQKKKSILKYNEGLNPKSAFKVVPSKQGIGIALQF